VNRLVGESSPYLRQHAGNPVDWYPWGDEAFAEARRRDVPVLLSVGYSACHWCHVMAHESFEDPSTAAVMNELFVNVKVDREERPDVDAVYMEAVQTLTGSGGWPMTVFLDGDGRPFFGGTYFPPVGRQGMPAFVDLLRAVDDAWRTKRDELHEQATKLTDAIRRSASVGGQGAVPGAEVLGEAVEQLQRAVDPQFGGFGRAPKFPQTMSLDLLLRRGVVDPVVLSLDAMASGGIYDHLGGGFARYSVDHRWLVPHFEKMLYDQALLARVYLHAWQVTGHDRYRQVLDETVEYVLRDLAAPGGGGGSGGGGWCSAEDADSEGEEGTFYVWSLEELQDVGGQAAVEWYGATRAGNFEGRNILHRPERGDLLRPPEVEAARQTLFERRAQRVRPGLDDKVLTEWNALFLSTLAEAAAATGRTDWLAAAVANGEFLLRELRRDDGRWLRSWQVETGARHLAYAADHAALVDAFTRLAEATGEARWIARAHETAIGMLERFWDDRGGALFTTGHDAEALVARQKDLLDNATPSANSMAAYALLRLAALTGDDRLAGPARHILGLVGPSAGAHPTAFGQLLAALDLELAGSTEIAVVGDRRDLLDVVRAAWRPHAVVAWGEPYDSPLWHDRLPGHAYVCRDYACQLPAATPDELRAQLAP
jgi:uncharacterized protein YyaL (SSP411 family)